MVFLNSVYLLLMSFFLGELIGPLPHESHEEFLKVPRLQWCCIWFFSCTLFKPNQDFPYSLSKILWCFSVPSWMSSCCMSSKVISDSANYKPPGSSVHGILQARILEWVAIPFSRGSSQCRGWTWVSCIAGRFFIIWDTGEAWISRMLHKF